MSKRGLSREEKLTKMVELFHETRDFFTLKELEKIAPKSKGIVPQSVKEILDELVSNGLVNFDKIGTSNYYWAFPSAAGAAKQAALDKYQAETTALKAKVNETQLALVEAEKGREDTAERQGLIAALQEAKAVSESLKAELVAFGAADPVRYQRKVEAINVAKASASRWTDNTLTLIQFASTMWIDEQQIRVVLGISDDWEDMK